jgi:hypothetical protein
METDGVGEIRCPMCGKANPSGADACDFCGARLKPVRGAAGPASGREGPTSDAGGGEAEVPDWLARIRSQASGGGREEAEEPEAEEREPAASSPRRGGTGSLLDRLKSYEGWETDEPPIRERAVPPEPAKVPPAGAPGGSGTLPETISPPEKDEGRHWMDALDEAGGAQPQEGRAAGEIPDWLQTFADELDEEAAEEIPPWLARIRAQQRKALEGEAAREERPEPRAEGKWWEDALSAAEGTPPIEGTPAPPVAGERERPQARAPDGGESGPPPEPLEPLVEEIGEGEAKEPFEHIPGGGGDAGGRTAPQPPAEGEFERPGRQAERAVPGEEEPAGRQAVYQRPPFESERQPREREPAASAPSELPDEDQLPSGTGTGEESRGRSPENVLPHIPALIMGRDQETMGEEVEDIDLGSIELPQWLTELQDIEEEELEAEAKRGEALEPAKLPSWLEAMRPLETIRPRAEVEPEEGRVIETSGPLAGLRGALTAEPIVAMPRQPSIGGERLDITERQFARAEIMGRMIAEESEEIPAAGRRRAPLPILRWAISALLSFAVLIPSLFQGQLFAIPARWPQELAPLITIVEGLPSDRPILLVIDYDPSSAPEMERMGEALLDHAILRGLQLVTVSTRPSGPALAEHLLAGLGVPGRLIYGERYYDLGYLAGGESGVQLFASSPRDAVLRGFRTSGAYRGESPWSTPILRDVDSLSDFAAIAVLTSGTESARNWVEQTRSRLGTRPLVMVLSMGISPIVRPYYEAREPQVDALLSGLPAAVSYEQVLGGSGAASNLWDAYGGGLWVAIGALSVGVAYGLATLAVVMRRKVSGDV